MPPELLPFHRAIVGELIHEDGLTIMASGLGLIKVIESSGLPHCAVDGGGGLRLHVSASSSVFVSHSRA